MGSIKANLQEGKNGIKTNTRIGKEKKKQDQTLASYQKKGKNYVGDVERLTKPRITRI